MSDEGFRREAVKSINSLLNVGCIGVLLLHPFNGLFSKTACVSRHQRSKPFENSMKQEMMGWHWHRLDHNADRLCYTLLQTDNHASAAPL